jgi:hypothetical protein
MTTTADELSQIARKVELLRHYLDREPRLFRQFDGFNPPTWPVGPGSEDADDDEFWCASTWELMNGATVRVLIPQGVDSETALRLLRKIADSIEREPWEDDKPFEDHFHGCPQCPPGIGPDDVYNAGRTHRGACHQHRTIWLLGSNLFDHWREETEQEQRERYREIEGYTDVS